MVKRVNAAGMKGTLAPIGIAAANLLFVIAVTGVSYASADEMMRDYSSGMMGSDSSGSMSSDSMSSDSMESEGSDSSSMSSE